MILLYSRFSKLTELADPIIEADHLKHAKECAQSSFHSKLLSRINCYVKDSGSSWANRASLLNLVWMVCYL